MAETREQHLTSDGDYAPPPTPPCSHCGRRDRKLYPADIICSWTPGQYEVVKGEFCSYECFMEWADYLETQGVVDVRIRRKRGEVV